MDALALLRSQSATADGLLAQVIATLTPQQAAWHAEGSTVNQIGSILAHLYATEDRAISRGLGRSPLLERDAWADRIGIDPTNPWKRIEQVDVDALRGYAAAVHRETIGYLDTLDPATLTREVESPRGKRPLSDLLSLALVLHKMAHAGEIAAILGDQGQKGFPF